MYSSGDTGISHLKKHNAAETFEILEGLEPEVRWSGFKEWRLQNHETERNLICSNINYRGARSGAVIKTLCYKPEGLGFDSRWYCWIFSLT
jgi:hypothetical protein